MEESKKFLISLLVMVIVLLAINAVGVYFYSQYQGAKIVALQECRKSITMLQSKIGLLDSLRKTNFNSITINGNVKEISAGYITISSGTQNFKVAVATPSKVSFYSATGKISQAQLSDIKIGKKVSVNARLSADYQLVGFNIYIY